VSSMQHLLRSDRFRVLLLALGVALTLATSSRAQAPAPGTSSASAPVPAGMMEFRPARGPDTPFSRWMSSVSHVETAGDMARDRKSRLVWARCLVGQRLEDRVTKCVGEATPMTLAEAQAYAAAQPGGWRVPTSEELLAILPVVCPPDKEFWGGQVIRVALRGQRVLSASREAGGSGVLMPRACDDQVQAEPATTRAPVLLVTAEDSAFMARRKEERDRFNAELQAMAASAAARDAAARATAASAAAAERPPLLAQQDGTVTRARLQGSLAPTRDLPCLRGDQIEALFTPPDLYTGFLKCLDERRAEDAALMFSVAGIYSRFDARRIDDPSVRGGPQVLIINTSAGFTPRQREFFVKVQRRVATSEATQAFCEVLARIGPPIYAPRYLVLHGLKAFTAANPMDNALVPGFDANGNWASLLESYGHCGK
jgi:hypothetical protein